MTYHPLLTFLWMRRFCLLARLKNPSWALFQFFIRSVSLGVLLLSFWLIFGIDSDALAVDTSVVWSSDFNGFTYFLIDDEPSIRCTRPPVDWIMSPGIPCPGTPDAICMSRTAQSCQIISPVGGDSASDPSEFFRKTAGLQAQTILMIAFWLILHIAFMSIPSK